MSSPERWGLPHSARRPPLPDPAGDSSGHLTHMREVPKARKSGTLGGATVPPCHLVCLPELGKVPSVPRFQALWC